MWPALLVVAGPIVGRVVVVLAAQGRTAPLRDALALRSLVAWAYRDIHADVLADTGLDYVGYASGG